MENTVWKLFNLANTLGSPVKFDSKDEAIQYATENAEDKEKPFIRINEQDRTVDYRGKVYL
jgi:hypothetical protein